MKSFSQMMVPAMILMLLCLLLLAAGCVDDKDSTDDSAADDDDAVDDDDDNDAADDDDDDDAADDDDDDDATDDDDDDTGDDDDDDVADDDDDDDTTDDDDDDDTADDDDDDDTTDDDDDDDTADDDDDDDTADDDDDDDYFDGCPDMQLQCANVISENTTTGFANRHSSYNCSAHDESGPEVIYQVSLPEPAALYVSRNSTDYNVDLFLLRDCDDSQSCIYTADTTLITGCLDTGTYYLVADGQGGSSGTFSFNITCVRCDPDPDQGGDDDDDDVADDDDDQCNLLNEQFEGAVPEADWTVTNDSASGGVWERNDIAGDASNRTSGSGGTGHSAVAFPYTSNNVEWDTSLITPPIYLNGYLSYNLTYVSNFQDYAGNGDGYLYITTDGGANWEQLDWWTTDMSSSGQAEDYDLSAYDFETIQIRWRYTCSSSTAWYWHIDNVCITGSVPVIVQDDDDDDDDDTAGSDILLMGDDVDAEGWQVYRDALTAAGVTWDERNLDTRAFPGASALSLYSTIIWFDESSLTPSHDECQLVADWLSAQSGRSLFITSVDFLWDLQNGLPGNGEHNLYQLLNVTYNGDNSGDFIAEIEGTAADPITGDFVSPTPLALSTYGNSNGDFAALSSVATVAGHYGSGGDGSGFGALAWYDQGNYRVVWLGVNFHNGLVDPAQQNTLMTNIINFFNSSW